MKTTKNKFAATLASLLGWVSICQGGEGWSFIVLLNRVSAWANERASDIFRYTCLTNAPFWRDEYENWQFPATIRLSKSPKARFPPVSRFRGFGEGARAHFLESEVGNRAWSPSHNRNLVMGLISQTGTQIRVRTVQRCLTPVFSVASCMISIHPSNVAWKRDESIVLDSEEDEPRCSKLQGRTVASGYSREKLLSPPTGGKSAWSSGTFASHPHMLPLAQNMTFSSVGGRGWLPHKVGDAQSNRLGPKSRVPVYLRVLNIR